MLTNDPAKWIVVGILACIQFTYWAWKRSEAPFAWKNLVPGIITISLTGGCCMGILLFNGQVILGPWIAMICGLILSGRQTEMNIRVGCTLLGVAVALGLIAVQSGCQGMKEYSQAKASWEYSYYACLPRLHMDDHTKRFPAEYLDTSALLRKNDPHRATLQLSIPSPLWHSIFTGVSGRKTVPYRIWLPGGTAAETIKGALAVPLGTPPGSERKLGIPLDTYRVPAQVEEF